MKSDTILHIECVGAACWIIDAQRATLDLLEENIVTRMSVACATNVLGIGTRSFFSWL